MYFTLFVYAIIFFMEVLLETNIDLNLSLYSGQNFLWAHENGVHTACVNGIALSAVQCERGILLCSDYEIDAEFFKNYFDINRDYVSVLNGYKNDIYVSKAAKAYPGLHVLNQPVWETLCMFIISANNNIKRITGIVRTLSSALGEEYSLKSNMLHAFPSADALASSNVEFMYKCGLGYRAPYIHEAAQAVSAGFPILSLPGIGYEEAKRELLKIKGVGEKVADCILLFSCGYSEAFPVDTWVIKLMQSLYKTTDDKKLIKKRIAQLFPTDAGIIQQYLFHAARMGLYGEL